MVFPVLIVAAVAALVLVWLLRYNHFEGKLDFTIAAIAMLWWLLFVGREVTAVGADCKIFFACCEWPGIVLLPVAWCFFVWTYLHGKPWLGPRLRVVALIGMPLLAFGLVVTNPWHQMFYTSATSLDASGTHVNYDHGPAFYLMVVLVYPFVIATIGLIVASFRVSEPRIWFFLTALGIVTLTPFAVNMAYVFAGVTFGGFDPTPLTFAVVLMIFSWLLANNRLMDTVALGRDVLYYTSSEPVLVADTKRQVLASNDAGLRTLFATPPEGGIENGVLHQPVAAFLDSLTQTVSEMRGEMVEIGCKIFEPRAVPVSGPIRRPDRSLGWSVSFIDITDRERRTQELRKALEDAQAAMTAKDEFIAVASHELRTPMTSLRGGVDLLLSGMLGEMPASSLQILELVRRNGDRLSLLIETLLDLRSLQAGDLELDPRPTDLSCLLEDAIGEHRILADARAIALENAGEQRQVDMLVDRLRVRQIVDNLLSNAIKFSDPGGHVRCSVATCGEKVRISVEDDGIGIPEGAEDIVFGKFSQLDRGSTRKADGLGLGLNISRELAWKLGGELHYVSAPGQGTVFHLDLPKDCGR